MNEWLGLQGPLERPYSNILVLHTKLRLSQEPGRRARAEAS